VQLSYFTRYSSVHFVPDTIGDLVFNGVASNVFRSDVANGVSTDAAYRLNDAHTLRGGLLLRTDLTDVVNTNTLLPVVDDVPVDAPFTVTDPSKKLGYTIGFYVQDEWRITNWLILSSGLRYDQYWAYITENQFSPRFSITWKPFDTTTFTPKVRSDLVDRHQEYKAKGDEARGRASQLFFEKLRLLGMLGNTELHAIVTKASANLRSVHNALNNFYNEPPFAERLAALTSGTRVPKTAQYE